MTLSFENSSTNKAKHKTVSSISLNVAECGIVFVFNAVVELVDPFLGVIKSIDDLVAVNQQHVDTLSKNFAVINRLVHQLLKTFDVVAQDLDASRVRCLRARVSHHGNTEQFFC